MNLIKPILGFLLAVGLALHSLLLSRPRLPIMTKPRLTALTLLLVLSLPLAVFGKDAIEVRIDTGDFKDGIFPRAERVVLGATLQNRTKMPVKVSIGWKIATDEKQPVGSHSDATTLEPGGKTRVSGGVGLESVLIFT